MSRLLVLLTLLGLPLLGLSAGLGKVTLYSELGQALQAEVAIIGADDYDDEQLLVTLADKRVFEAQNIELGFNHYRLKMRTGTNAQQQRVVFLTSTTPITEPYLQFIIEMRYPDGSVSKTLSLLFDAPARDAGTEAFSVQGE
jgi:pilus assembly protein FimV